jgi:SAM-dependent methyltransferase
VGDAIFNDPRLARVYDAIEGERGDLEVYVEMVDELGARSVLDIGCGTGTFACMLAGRGIDVVGVDPAWASLEIARAKPGAGAVRWLHGDATTLPPLTVDAASMTGNVAQVFLTDEDWGATLRGTWEALRPGGHLVFETRDPTRRAWERWTPELTRSVLDVPGVGVVEDWGELTEVSGQFVTFRSTTVFRSDNLELESTSTLRFRDRPEIEVSLEAAGFQTVEIRDAPDRPGLEFVYLAVRPD